MSTRTAFNLRRKAATGEGSRTGARVYVRLQAVYETAKRNWRDFMRGETGA